MNRADTIYYLKGLAEGYAHQSPNSEFEVKHLRDVEQAVLQLCQARKLSVEKGLIMAYSHDLGRLKGGVMGKRHSEASGKILSELLENEGYSPKAIKGICKGVKRHNQKDKIHGTYSELIKDGDSLAHAWEGLVERGDYFEQVRVLTALSKAPQVNGANRDSWRLALNKAYSKIVKCIHDDIAFSAHSEFWVHDLRVAIRKMRSILWILKHQKELRVLEALIQLDSRLEKMAKALETVRILQVILRKVALDKGTYKDLHQKITTEFLSIGRQYDSLFQLEGMKESLEQVIEGLPLQLDEPCQNLLYRTFKLARSVDLSHSKKLHTLRIYTKRMKYLSQMGLIQITVNAPEEDLSELLEATLVEINELLGDMHDIYEFQQLIRKHLFTEELQVLKREVSKHLFLVNKMSRIEKRLEF